MSIRIDQQDRVPLLELLEQAQRSSAKSSSIRSPDWEGLKAEITNGDISYNQFVELRQIFTILNGTPLTTAQQLLSRAEIFGIWLGKMPRHDFWQYFAGRIRQINAQILNYAMMDDKEVPFISFLETAIYNYKTHKDRLDLVYTLRIQNDPILRNWPGLALTFRTSPFVSLDEFIKYFAHGPDEDFYTIISFLRHVTAHHHDTYMRFFALKATGRILEERSKQGLSMPEEYLVPFFEAGLGDREPIVAMTAWQTVAAFSMKEAIGIGENWFSDQPTSYLRESPEFGIGRYIFDDPFVAETWNQLLPKIEASRAYDKAVLSINTFSPLHSLMDYHPGPFHRQNIMFQKYSALKNIIARLGIDKRDEVLKEFFDLPSHKDQNIERIAVLELPSGERYLYQGHHRIAALILAAVNKIIPLWWLEKIPVRLTKYTGDIPVPLVKRVLTRGIGLMWTELFPAGTDFSNTPMGGVSGRNTPSSPVSAPPGSGSTPVPPAPVHSGSEITSANNEITAADEWTVTSAHLRDEGFAIYTDDYSNFVDDGADELTTGAFATFACESALAASPL